MTNAHRAKLRQNMEKARAALAAKRAAAKATNDVNGVAAPAAPHRGRYSNAERRLRARAELRNEVAEQIQALDLQEQEIQQKRESFRTLLAALDALPS